MENTTEIDSDAAKLIMQIMAQNSKDTAYTTNSLMEGYRRDAARANAELAAIRWNINLLFEAGVQPTESAVINASWPTLEQIEDFMEEFLSDD